MERRRRRRSAYSAVRRFLWILPRKAVRTEGKVEMYHIHPSHRSHVVRNCTLSDEVHCTPTSAGFHDRPLWLSAPSSATSVENFTSRKGGFPIWSGFLGRRAVSINSPKDMSAPRTDFGNVSPRSGTIKSTKSGAAKYLKPT